MIVAISGTPGTGKTSAAKKLSEITGWELIGLNELAEKKGLHSGYDEERYCKIVDTKAINSEIDKMRSSGKNLLIESHYAHEVPVDLVIILRTNPNEMRKRGKLKGWDFNKTEENVLAEIMEECKIDSLVKGRITKELDTTGKTAEESARMMAKIMQLEGMFIEKSLKIPEKLKEELREPYGKLFEDHKKALKCMKGSSIVSVGDEASYTLFSAGTTPDIMIVDGRVRRKPTDINIDINCETITAKNETGYLTNDLWMAVDKALKAKKPVKIQVNGEEDMAVLPVMIQGNEGVSIIYGLFDKGVCVVKIDEKTRKIAKNLLKKISAAQ